MVQASARHLLNLINDLLDLSRIESGKMEVVYDTFPLEPVVDEVLQSLQPTAAMKKIALEKDIDVPGRIRTDRKKLFQVLLNLVNNAVKFTDQGSVKMTARLDNGILNVSILDTGIGIKTEQLGMLFEAFRQVEGSARRHYEGTGLGLYLCKKILAMLGGQISVESQFGQGSRFAFHIPLAGVDGGTQ
jgi:signal transduction histidine kinase